MELCACWNPGLTFSKLCSLEARLLELETRAKSIKDDPEARFCANHRWYGCAGCAVCNGGLKQELVHLVGWEAENPALRSEAAYDVAYEYLYRLLPPCRNCLCF